MTRLESWALVGVLCLVAGLTTVSAPTSAGANHTSWCTEDPSPPCVVAATVNGQAVTASHPTWDIIALGSTFEGGTSILWNVQHKTNADPYELGAGALDDTWWIKFDTGTTIPRVAFAHGTKATTSRNNDGDGTYKISISTRPIVISGECDQSVWPWSCPETATTQRVGYLGGEITDYGTWDDTVQRAAMNGMSFATNVAATSIPPEIGYDSATDTNYLFVRLASPHYREDGSTLVRGFAHVRIPNAFLREVYGIDMPATMTGSGLVAGVNGSSAGSGTVTVTQESGDDAMLVDITGVTFSARVMRIKRGTIVPTRPTDLRARRITTYRGRVGFDAARPRGSRITGYRVRCEARRGSDVAAATGTTSPVEVRGLVKGIPYDCRVRALSKAGPGPWSAIVLMHGYID